MSLTIIKHTLGAIALLAALTTYTICVQPTVPFWDCGEFTAASVQQQVPHPPGAPLFLLFGKLFHMTGIGDAAVRVNMVSVFASAITIWLCYYIGIMLIRALLRKPESDMGDALLVYGSAFVGALAFCWSDTFWFNAVESEVYASSSLFVALVVYLMLRWNEVADEQGHERYLLMIAYLIGLSTGVHLLAVLAIFSLALLVYFRKYAFSLKSFIIMGAMTLVVFAVVYPGVVKYFPALLAGNLPWKNEAHEYYVENAVWVQLLGIALVLGSIAGTVYGLRSKKSLISLGCASFVAMFLGYTSYTQILIRSNARPPMNENAPKTFKALISYLGREQYGDAPMFPRRFERDPDKVEAYKKYGPYTPPPTKHIESIRNPGMSYSVPDYAAAKSSSGDWTYLFRYQLDHMFWRYMLWNFFGRSSDVQDADAWTWLSSKKYAEIQNYANGYASHFPVNFFGLPFLMGLLGMYVHFRRDWRTASVFMVMFLVMGVVAAFAQNQQEPQPRERDYFYTGAFMVWCLWIAIGCAGIIDLLRSKSRNALVSAVAVTLCVVIVPINMASQGWFIHSRAGNYVPFDYAYNILQSCEQDGILVTNGDNDTFPLWCLQDVYGVRRDVRIVNMSLAGTQWYVNDLKNLEPWGAKKLPLSFSDASLTADEFSENALGMKSGPAESIRFGLSDDVCKKYGLGSDSASRTFQWTATGYPRGNNSYAFSVAQQVIIDYIKQSRFERPLYFSITCGYPTSELYCGLGDHTRLEGMAYRVCPTIQGPAGEVVNDEIMSKCLLQLRQDDQYSQTPDYGFKLRNLNTPRVYYDETHRRYIDNYRTLFIRYANILLNGGNKAKGAAVLDTMNAVISQEIFPMSYALLQDISSIYENCGAHAQAVATAKLVARQCDDLVAKPYLQPLYSQFIQRMPPSLTGSQAYSLCGEFDKARAMLQQYRQESRDEAGYDLRLTKLNVDELESKKMYGEALQIVHAYSAKMKSQNLPQLAEAIQVFDTKAVELEKKMAGN